MQLPSFVVLGSWILALVACVIYTAQFCRLVEDWNLFQSWSLLLSQHSEQLQPAIPEYLYIARTFPPYFGRILLAAVPCVSLQPALQFARSALPQPDLWIPYGELGVLASLLCSACWPYMRFLWTVTLDDVLCLAGWILWRMQHSPWSIYTSEDGRVVDGIAHLHPHPAVHIRVHVMAVLGFVILMPVYARRLRHFSHLNHLFAWLLPHTASLVWLFLAIDWLQLSSSDGILRGLMLSLAAALLRSNCNRLTKANLLLCCITSYSSGSAVGLTPWLALGLAVVLIAVCQFLTLQSSFIPPQRPFVHLWTVFKSALLVACLSILVMRVMDTFG